MNLEVRAILKGMRKMIKIVEKPTEVIICDFCGEEAKSSQRCLMCGRDACYRPEKPCCAKEEMPFKIKDILRRSDKKLNPIGYICRDCSKTKGTIKEILDKLVDSQYYPR